jgi:hypothetical protein
VGGYSQTTRHKSKTSKSLHPLGRSLNARVGTFEENVVAFSSPPHLRGDISLPANRRRKKYDPSKNYYHRENLSTLMTKIKETPKHMIDYRNNLETSMFKKKMGLEKINDFQMALHQANVDNKAHALPKLREKSFESSAKKNTEQGVKLDRDSVASIETPPVSKSKINEDLCSPITQRNKLRFKSLNHHRLISK